MAQIFAVRFSDDIQSDITRNWSAWQHPAIGGTFEECLRDVEELGLNNDIRELPEGGFACVHHDGISCYVLEGCENINEVMEAINDNRDQYDGSGFGEYTIGKIEVIKSIPAAEIGSCRDMHILLIDDYNSEL